MIEILTVFVEVGSGSLPKPGNPSKNLGYQSLNLTDPDVAATLGDDWQPTSHHVFTAPDGRLMLSIMCTRETIVPDTIVGLTEI
jgi:hypothetical protein